MRKYRPSTTIRLIEAGQGEGIPLSNRETDVVLAIMAGNTLVKDIARIVGTTETTVNNYLHYIYRKANVPNMAAVVLMISGVIPCARALKPTQGKWRRKFYQIEENA